MTFKIGYRRPPEKNRFTKGTSGNPNGRPKGSRNFITLLQKELDQRINITENGCSKTVTRLQAVIKRLVAAALGGEPKAVTTLIEIMRQTGRLNVPEIDMLLPANYEEVLRDYVSKLGDAAKDVLDANPDQGAAS